MTDKWLSEWDSMLRRMNRDATSSDAKQLEELEAFLSREVPPALCEGRWRRLRAQLRADVPGADFNAVISDYRAAEAFIRSHPAEVTGDNPEALVTVLLSLAGLYTRIGDPDQAADAYRRLFSEPMALTMVPALSRALAAIENGGRRGSYEWWDDAARWCWEKIGASGEVPLADRSLAAEKLASLYRS